MGKRGKDESTRLVLAVLYNENAIGVKAHLHEMNGFFDIERVKVKIMHIDRPVVHVLLNDHFVFHDI